MNVDTSYDAVVEFLKTANDINRPFGGGSSVVSSPKSNAVSCKTEGLTLAEACVQNRAVESLKLLLKSGCSTKGLLQTAIKTEKKNVFDVLIESGVCLDEASDEGITPLIAACRLNKLYYVRSLLDHKADPSITDDEVHCNLPLSIACSHGNVEIVQILLDANSPTASFDNATVPLTIAVRGGMTKIVYLLLQYGADPNYHGLELESALDIAISKDNADIARILIACGADLQKYDLDGLSPQIQEVFDEWIDPGLPYIPDPNPYNEIDSKQKQLIQELQTIQGAMSKFITDSRKIDFHQNFVTPTLNLQNSMLVNFVKFMKKMDYFGKVLFQKRIQLLVPQYDSICASERALMEQIVDDDERLFAEILERSKIIVSDTIDSFRPDAVPNLETMTAQLPKRREDCLPKLKPSDIDNMKLNRSYLLYVNQLLTIFNMNITEIFRLFETFSASFIGVLDQAVAALTTFRDVLLEVRQTSIDIVVDPHWAKESKVDQTCIEQCEKIQIDSDFLFWEKERFSAMKMKIDRCLRQAMH